MSVLQRMAGLTMTYDHDEELVRCARESASGRKRSSLDERNRGINAIEISDARINPKRRFAGLRPSATVTLVSRRCNLAKASRLPPRYLEATCCTPCLLRAGHAGPSTHSPSGHTTTFILRPW